MSKPNPYFDSIQDDTEPILKGSHPDWRVGIEYDHQVQTTPFDFDSVDRDLGLEEPTPAEELQRNADFERAADLLEALAVWLASSHDLGSAGRRALSMAWVLRPRAFGGDVKSMADLARRYGGTRAGYQKMATQLYAMGRGIFTSSVMSNPEDREKAPERALEWHRAQGHEQSGPRRKTPELNGRTG